MILGVGVDIVDTARMERAINGRSAETFIRRVFGPDEISACRASARPAEGFAARFAAKEAVTKALGTGFSRGIRPGQILVIGTEFRRPAIELIGRARDIAADMGVSRIHVSLTHSHTTACAFVVIETADGRTCP